MKMTQSWKRDEPSSAGGESITLTVVYSSFDKAEIDELEQKMPKGILVMTYDNKRKGEQNGQL